jgi:ElaB/YqjD/DUF883 family membrane-anchored ribosome-binding protein
MPEVAERAQQVQEAAQEQVQERTEQARTKLRDEVDTRSTDFGQQVSGTSEAIREAASSLREKGQDGPARATEQAAEKMEQAGRWLTESDADRILNDVEDFARRQPWAVLAGGLVVGFAASRFLKSSSQQRHGARGPGRSFDSSAQTRELAVGNGVGTGVGTGGVQPPADGGSVSL